MPTARSPRQRALDGVPSTPSCPKAASLKGGRPHSQPSPEQGTGDNGRWSPWSLIPERPNAGGCCRCGDLAAATFCSSLTNVSLRSQAEKPPGLELGAAQGSRARAVILLQLGDTPPAFSTEVYSHTLLHTTFLTLKERRRGSLSPL